jgi:pantoate--beta-alanine ligase
MMLAVVSTIADIRLLVASARKRGLTVGVVPTMGALHEGHAALIRRAREQNGYVVVTLFVNPTQFDRKEDLDRYPRPLEADLECCRALRVDSAFAPDASEMYPGDPLTFVEVGALSSRLEGEFRPGHFRGVATVVAKLLNIVQADRAYFGEKDAQQLAVIQKMAADLNIPVTVVPVETVREEDGLALSSRNRLLTPEDRAVAPVLYKALSAARAAIEDGSTDPAQARQAALAVLAEVPAFRLDYLEVVDPATFQPVDRITREVRIAAAAWLGIVRLIDNVRAQSAQL